MRKSTASHPMIVVALGVLAASLVLAGCRKAEEEVVEEPVQTAEQLAQEQEAERREAATSEIAARVGDLEETLAALGQAIERRAPDGPKALEESWAELDAKLDAPGSLLQELQQAGPGDWEAAKDRLEGALADLEATHDQVRQELSEWEQRESAARAARQPLKLPIDESTGLLEGLDGGEYPQYLVSVVERVQQRLRREGLYAGPADGYFDVETRAAVGEFQQRHELYVSGVPSPETRRRLFASDRQGGIG